MVSLTDSTINLDCHEVKRAELSETDETWEYFDVNEICESKARLIG